MADKIDCQIKRIHVFCIVLISNNKTLARIPDTNISTLMHVNAGPAQHNQPLSA